MAKGLLPLALRINLDPALRLALALICDMAEEREDGTYVAIVSAMALAAMLGTSENSARKTMDRLRLETTFLERGRRQSEWVVTLPSAHTINDVVRRNWTALGGIADHAPAISKLWKVSRRPYPNKGAQASEKPATQGRFSEQETGHAGAVFALKNQPYRGTKPATQGRFQNAPYIGVNTEHANGRSETANHQTAIVDTHSERRPDTKTGDRLAERGSPDASQQDAASGGIAPDPAGMVG